MIRTTVESTNITTTAEIYGDIDPARINTPLLLQQLCASPSKQSAAEQVAWIHERRDCGVSHPAAWGGDTPTLPTSTPSLLMLGCGRRGRGGRLLQDSWVHKNKSPGPAVTQKCPPTSPPD